MPVPRFRVAVAALAMLASPLSAQSLSQRLETWRRHGSWAELGTLSTETEQQFRVNLPTLRQEFLLEPVCRFTLLTRRLVDGTWRLTRTQGDAANLAPRLETVRNDTTGVTGLRVLTRDAMPVLEGVTDGARPAELTAMTIWVGVEPPGAELERRRALLTKLVTQCRRYF